MKQPSASQPSASRPAKKQRLPLILGMLLIVIAAVLVFSLSQARIINTFGKVSFDHALPVPALAASTLAPNGVRTFDLTLQTGATQFFKGVNTATWGVNGSYLGPTLRAKRGEKVQINVKNQLPEISSLHWHGMHLPAVADGGPHQPVAPGATWSPAWTINQPAATLWYHPHPHGTTEAHVYHGIAGMFILDDGNPVAASLPHAYGADDLPIIVQDKEFDAQHQLKKSLLAGKGPTGNVGKEILVNGARTPHVDVATGAVRLRLLNGSTARIYNFGLSNGAPMQLIATDGGLLARPATTTRVLLSPGERAEVIVALEPGRPVTLRSYATDLGAGFVANRISGADDNLDIMELRPTAALAAAAPVPNTLSTIQPLSASAATITRQILLSGENSIDHKSMDMNRIDFNVTRGATEIWEVTNRGGSPHNFHIHDVQFQVLSVDGAPPPPELQGHKDTIFVRESQAIRLIMQFSDYSDPAYPYMYHCHLLRHEDEGMMGQFLVLEPGQAPSIHSHTHAQ